MWTRDKVVSVVGDILRVDPRYLTSMWTGSKKDKREEVVNYCQISLLPIVSKIQEKCVPLLFVQYICDRIHQSQHGYRQGLSYATQLLQVIHEIGVALDKGAETDAI